MKNLTLHIAALLFLPLLFSSCASDQWAEPNSPQPLKEGVYTQHEQWELLFNVDGEIYELTNPKVSNWYKAGNLYHKVWVFSHGNVNVNLSYKLEDGTVNNKDNNSPYEAAGIGEYNGESFILNNLSYDDVNLFAGNTTMSLCNNQGQVPVTIQLVKAGN